MSRIAIFAALALGAGIAAAEDDGPAEPTRVYTNEDLRRFGSPAPVPPPTPADEVERQWDFVRDFLERELDRIDSRRRPDPVGVAPTPDPEPRRWPYPGYVLSPIGGHGRGPLASRPRPSPRPRFDSRVARHGYRIPRTDDPDPGRGRGRPGRSGPRGR